MGGLDLSVLVAKSRVLIGLDGLGLGLGLDRLWLIGGGAIEVKEVLHHWLLLGDALGLITLRLLGRDLLLLEVLLWLLLSVELIFIGKVIIVLEVLVLFLMVLNLILWCGVVMLLAWLIGLLLILEVIFGEREGSLLLLVWIVKLGVGLCLCVDRLRLLELLLSLELSELFLLVLSKVLELVVGLIHELVLSSESGAGGLVEDILRVVLLVLELVVLVGVEVEVLVGKLGASLLIHVIELPLLHFLEEFADFSVIRHGLLQTGELSPFLLVDLEHVAHRAVEQGVVVEVVLQFLEVHLQLLDVDFATSFLIDGLNAFE